MASPNKSSRRREMDFARLASEERFIVHSNDNIYEFWVEFEGPKGTCYEGGIWALHVVLPVEYPFKSPSIGFTNRIFHPNVDEMSGSVCLDVINQTWTPLYELTNVFDTFFPQLLLYPNPADPLNPEAAALQLRDPVGYASRVQEHVRLHATPERCREGLRRNELRELNPRSSLAITPECSGGLAPVDCSSSGVTGDASAAATPPPPTGVAPDGEHVRCLAPSPTLKAEEVEVFYRPDDIDI